MPSPAGGRRQGETGPGINADADWSLANWRTDRSAETLRTDRLKQDVILILIRMLLEVDKLGKIRATKKRCLLARRKLLYVRNIPSFPALPISNAEVDRVISFYVNNQSVMVFRVVAQSKHCLIIDNNRK